jgi:hypothetical protein
VIDKDAAHHPGSNAEEVGAIAPMNLALVNQPNVGFMDERRRLERVAGRFVTHVAGRQTTQVFVQKRHEPVAGITTALAPRHE